MVQYYPSRNQCILAASLDTGSDGSSTSALYSQNAKGGLASVTIMFARKSLKGLYCSDVKGLVRAHIYPDL